MNDRDTAALEEAWDLLAEGVGAGNSEDHEIWLRKARLWLEDNPRPAPAATGHRRMGELFEGQTTTADGEEWPRVL